MTYKGKELDGAPTLELTKEGLESLNFDSVSVEEPPGAEQMNSNGSHDETVRLNALKIKASMAFDAAMNKIDDDDNPNPFKYRRSIKR